MKRLSFLCVIAIAMRGSSAVQSGDPQTSEAKYIEALSNRDVQVRLAAVKAFGELGAEARRTIPRLIERLQDPDAEVRCSAVGAIGQIDPGAPRVFSSIAAKIEDTSDDVKLESVCFFVGRGSEAKVAISALSKLLESTPVEGCRDLRGNAGRALAGIAPDNNYLIPTLMKMLEDPTPAVRSDAASVLGSCKVRAARAVSALAGKLSDPSPDVREVVAFALGEIGPKAREAVPALAKALNDESRDVSLMAAQSLGRIGSEAKDAISALGKALDNDDPQLKTHVLQALRHIGPAARSMSPRVIRALEEKDPKVRRFAVQTLIHIGLDFQSVPQLLKWVDDIDPTIRTQIPTILGVIAKNDRRVLQILQQLSENGQSDVRARGL